MGKTKIIFIDESDLPPKHVFGKAYKLQASWVPWAAVEQIPKGMALELTPWMDGRTVRQVSVALHREGGRLANRFPHMHVITRGPAVFIWNPSDSARDSAEKRGHWRAWQLDVEV